MIRFAGIALIALTPVLASFALMRRLKTRRRQLNALLKMVSRMKAMIRYQALPVADLIRHAAGGEDLECLSFLRPAPNEEENAAEVIINRLSGCLYPDDLPLAQEFFAGLGRTDVEGQTAHCELYETLLREQYDKTAEMVKEKGKLYYSLGGLGAAMCVILLL